MQCHGSMYLFAAPIYIVVWFYQQTPGSPSREKDREKDRGFLQSKFRGDIFCSGI